MPVYRAILGPNGSAKWERHKITVFRVTQSQMSKNVVRDNQTTSQCRAHSHRRTVKSMTIFRVDYVISSKLGWTKHLDNGEKRQQMANRSFIEACSMRVKFAMINELRISCQFVYFVYKNVLNWNARNRNDQCNIDRHMQNVKEKRAHGSVAASEYKLMWIMNNNRNTHTSLRKCDECGCECDDFQHVGAT